jgi:hypothetical protein
MKLHATLLSAAILVASATISLAGPSVWPPNYPTRVNTREQAASCCLPKEKVALACKDCKTINEKSGKDKKGIMAWFAPDSTHGCSGCGGRITVKQSAAGKGATYGKYTHTCSKCGKGSAYTCATHKA